MKNELLLNELKNIITVEKNGFKCLDPIKYDALIEKVKIEIAAEANKDTTTKGRINFINRYIDKMSDTRPILKYYSSQFAGFKAFTDSFMMVLLNENDAAGLQWKSVDEYIEKNPTAVYPDLKRIVNFDFENLPNKITLKVNDILNDIKAAGKPKNKYDFDTGIIYKYNNNDKIGFGSQLMKAFLTFMNCSSKDEITLYFKNNVTPAFMKNKNGSIGLILPIRIND